MRMTFFFYHNREELLEEIFSTAPASTDIGVLVFSWIFLKDLNILDWIKGFLINFHLLGFICPSALSCSLLSFRFVYHEPPRHPKQYL